LGSVSLLVAITQQVLLHGALESYSLGSWLRWGKEGGQAVHTSKAILFFIISQDSLIITFWGDKKVFHRIIEWFGFEGTLNII